jgi:hypothetical protein
MKNMRNLPKESTALPISGPAMMVPSPVAK